MWAMLTLVRHARTVLLLVLCSVTLLAFVVAPPSVNHHPNCPRIIQLSLIVPTYPTTLPYPQPQYRFPGRDIPTLPTPLLLIFFL